jgi:hypothetical protein
MLRATPSSGIKIATEGLALYYDFSIRQSYPTTGSTMFDLASGANATMYGAKTFYTANGGYIADFGLNDSYTLIDTSFSRTGLSGLSIGAVIYYNASQYEGVKIFASTNSGGNDWGMDTRSGGNSIGFTSDGGSKSITGTLTQNTWNVVHVGRDVANSRLSLRINGNQRTTVTTSLTNVNFTNGWLFARNRGTGTQFRGRVGALFFYTRQLVPNEELMNYNALRLKYGI